MFGMSQFLINWVVKIIVEKNYLSVAA
jgi:hypothetical protein